MKLRGNYTTTGGGKHKFEIPIHNNKIPNGKLSAIDFVTEQLDLNEGHIIDVEYAIVRDTSWTPTTEYE